MSATVSTLPIPPVVKTILVRCTQATAFRVFTADIGRWFPLAMFSVKPAADCRLEPHVGGRLYEIAADGAETLWGHVLEWDPPRALALSWQARVTTQEAQRIEVTFRAVPGGAEVRLVHAGWEKLKLDGAGWREKYDGGWVEVFERRFKAFADAATR
ncbi:MAG: SRPBCC domain-containing protein [Sphingomonas sp.]